MDRASLRQEADRVQQIKLPIAVSLARARAEGGIWDESANLFDEAAKVADSLRRRAQREQHLASVAYVRRLELFDALTDQQPRYVLLQMKRDGTPRFASARLLLARAQAEVGLVAEAKQSRD